MSLPAIIKSSGAAAARIVVDQAERAARRLGFRRGAKLLKPARPNVGIEVAYRRRLYELVDDMTKSTEFWVRSAYRKNEPLVGELAQDEAGIEAGAVYLGGKRPWGGTLNGEPLRTARGAIIRFASAETATAAARRLAGDALPADELAAAMADLGQYWQQRFDDAAEKLADYFAKDVAKRSDAQLRKILRDGGWTVKFNPTPAQLDVLKASVHENVALIKSIPQQYHKNVEGMVMRSVARGRDLGTLSKELQEQYGVTKRRAALIARDQTNKAFSAFHESRAKEMDLTEAIWRHSHAGKKPRRKHLAADGTRYKVGVGLPVGDKGQHVVPGEEINCRCFRQFVIPGFGGN